MSKKKNKALKKKRHIFEHRLKYTVDFTFESNEPWTREKYNEVEFMLSEFVTRRLEKYKGHAWHREYEDKINQPRTEWQ